MNSPRDTELVEAVQQLAQLGADQARAIAAVDSLASHTPKRAAGWKAINARTEKYLGVLVEIITQPATTRAGIEAKARALLMHVDDDGEQATFEDRLSRSLARDVVAMIERAANKTEAAA